MCNANKSDVSTKVDRQKKGSLSASKSMNILIKEYDLTGTLYLNRIKAVRPLKWTNAEINVQSCNAAERLVSTKVDKH